MRHFKLFIPCLFFMFVQPASAAIDPASVAAYAIIASKVVSLFDSGANPYMTQIAQNHRMLKLMHERLDEFSDAFKSVIKNLEDLPKSIRREIVYSQNDDYRRNLIGHIDRIHKDFAQLAGGITPLFTPKERLASLEKHSDRVRTSAEDLSLPYIILGMQVEKAFYYGMGLEEHWHGIKGIDGIQEIYRARIEKMLNKDRAESLVSSMANLAKDIEMKKMQLEELLKFVDVVYTTSSEEVEICNSYTYIYVDVEESIQRTRTHLSQQIREHELPIVMQMHDLYRVMVSTAYYALATIRGQAPENRPTRPKSQDFLTDSVAVPELAAILDRAMEAHIPRIHEAKTAAAEHNRIQGLLIMVASEKIREISVPEAVSMMRLKRLLLAVTSASFAVSLCHTSFADQAVTWDKFDLGKARAVLRDFTISDLGGPEIMYEWENIILQVEQRHTNEPLIVLLRQQKEQWRGMSAEMERELADVIAQARKDAGIRKVVKILEAVAFIANVVDKLQEEGAKEVDGRYKPKEGQIRLRQEQYLEKFEGNEWKLLNLKKLWIYGDVPSEMKKPHGAKR